MPFPRKKHPPKEGSRESTFLHRVVYAPKARETSDSLQSDDKSQSHSGDTASTTGVLLTKPSGGSPQHTLQQSLLRQLEKQPDNPTLLILLGWSSPEARSAASYFQRALEIAPDNPVARDGLEWAAERLESMGTAQVGTLPVETTASSTTQPLVQERFRFPEMEAGPTRFSKPGRGDFRWYTLSRFYQVPFFRNLGIAILYLLLISGAELLTVLVDPVLGIILHATIMIMLIIHGTLIQQGPFRRYLVVLALAPLIRLLSLSLPLAMFNIPVIYRYMIVGVPLLMAVYFSARSVGLTANRLYFTWKGWPFQLLFSMTGLVLGTCEYFILRPQALVASTSWYGILIGVFILFVFTGFLEELIFRGLMQVTGVQLFGGTAIWILSLLFGILHIGYYSIFDVVFATVVGLLFGYFALKTRSLLGVSLAHGFTNVVLYIFLPLIIRK